MLYYQNIYNNGFYSVYLYIRLLFILPFLILFIKHMPVESPYIIIGTAVFSYLIGPIVVHYFKKFIDSRSKKDPFSDALTINSLITDKLEEIKDTVDADRIWLLQFHNGGNFYPTGKSIQKFSMVYEIVSEGAISCQHQFQNIPSSLFSKSINQLYNGEMIAIPDLNNNALNYGITNIIAESGTKSTYLFPVLSIKNEFIGIVGIDYLTSQVFLGDKSIHTIETEVASIGGELMKYLKS